MTRRVKTTIAAVGAAALMAGGAGAALGASAEWQSATPQAARSPIGRHVNVHLPGRQLRQHEDHRPEGQLQHSHDESLTNPGGTQPPGQQGGNDIGNQ